MKTEGWILVGIIALFTAGLFVMAMIGLPTKYGTAESAFPPNGNKVASILVIFGGVGCICFLCYRAWSTEEMQPKVGVYTVAAILTYELWLFVNRVIAVWG